MRSPSILQFLHDTISLKGFLHDVYEQIQVNPLHSWILNYPHSSLPIGSKAAQSYVLSILSGSEMCGNMLAASIKDKLKSLLELTYLVPFIFKRIGCRKSRLLLLALILI